MVRRPGRYQCPRRTWRGRFTPSDIAPAQLTQQQIDELQQQYRIADVLPLTPMQELLFHANTSHGHHDNVYAMQLDLTVTGPLDADRLRDAVHTVINRHPNLAARFCDQFDQPVQIIPADPVVPWRYVDSGNDPDSDEQIQRVRATERAGVCDLDQPASTITADPVVPWRYVELDAGDIEINEQIQQLCAAERAAVCDLAEPPASRVASIRTANDQHRIVLTNHHIVLDGWSLPILLQDIFAGYYGHRLPRPPRIAAM